MRWNLAHREQNRVSGVLLTMSANKLNYIYSI